jgi:hypothetical protein
MAVDLKYGRVTVENTPGTPFGEDEPVFIIRAQDKAAIDGIMGYFDAAADAGAEFTPEQQSAVYGHFVEWRETHETKVPD